MRMKHFFNRKVRGALGKLNIFILAAIVYVGRLW